MDSYSMCRYGSSRGSGPCCPSDAMSWPASSGSSGGGVETLASPTVVVEKEVAGGACGSSGGGGETLASAGVDAAEVEVVVVMNACGVCVPPAVMGPLGVAVACQAS